MKHVFIVNPAAGASNHAKEMIAKIQSIIKEEDYVIYETKAINDAKYYIKDYLQRNSGDVRFYACGGDGTLNEVVEGVYGYKNAEITCYPMGSGNDFLRLFGDINYFEKLEDLIHGKVVECDLLKVNNECCINIFNVGFDGAVVIRQRKLKRLPLVSGPLAYKLSVAIGALGPLNNKMKVTVDGEAVYEGKGVLAALANGICYGGGFYCAPKAKVNDGLVDLCLIKKTNILTFAKLVKSYKNGTFLEDPRAKDLVIYMKGKHFEMEFAKELCYSKDGETGKTRKIVLDILEKAIKFVIPSHIQY